MDREDILERLDKMDMEAFLTIGTPDKFRMVIVGGSGLVLLNSLARATLDIDAIGASAKILGIMEKYGASHNVDAYISNFPFNYEDRLHRLDVGGRKIDFFTASLEDIVIAKLCSDRSKDRQDIISEEVLSRINWDLLHILATDENEAKASALNERAYKDFISDYNEYVRRYGPNERVDV